MPEPVLSFHAALSLYLPPPPFTFSFNTVLMPFLRLDRWAKYKHGSAISMVFSWTWMVLQWTGGMVMGWWYGGVVAGGGVATSQVL